jgi:ABC-type Fe3+/spermidine/putrescine transport system ATPase subunit
VIQDLGEKMNITFILVSHDPLDILSWANTILVMKDGQVIQQGTPEQVYRQPVNEYCAGLLGEYNLINIHAASAFAAIPGLDFSQKKALIRPEQFTITSSADNAAEGIVQQILYWGSYYTVDVLVDHQLIRIKTDPYQISTGNKLFLSFSAADVLYIND